MFRITLSNTLMALCFTLTAAWTVSSAFAQDSDRAKAFLKVTGFDVALDSIALAASDAPRMLGMEANDFGHAWTRISEKVFDTEDMRQTAIDILDQTLDDDLLAHAAGFYATDLGQRLVEVENVSHMIEDSDAKLAEGEALISDWMANGNPRITALRELMQATGSSDQSVRALQEITVRFLLSASHAGVLEYEVDESSLRALLKAQEPDLRVNLLRNGLANAAYTYQEMSVEEIETYSKALQHPKMRLVYELMYAIQFEIMADRFEVLAFEMAELFPGEEL